MADSKVNEVVVCKKCGDDITSSQQKMLEGNYYCLGCYSDEIVNSNQDNVKETNNNPIPYQNKYVGALETFAVLELIGSIITSIYIWANYATIEVSYGIYYTFTKTEVNPIGIGLGIGVLVQGIVIYIILSALKVMAEDIADIKNLSDKNNI